MVLLEPLGFWLRSVASLDTVGQPQKPQTNQLLYFK